MKRLNYNIYTNINDESFINVSEMLTPLESKMSTILRPDGWRLHSPVSNSDALAIDFIKKDSTGSGNIGITFDDMPKMITFTFYVTKAFDEDKIRYFLRGDVFKNKELASFENDISKFVDEALEKYNGWSKQDIIALGVKVRLSN